MPKKMCSNIDTASLMNSKFTRDGFSTSSSGPHFSALSFVRLKLANGLLRHVRGASMAKRPSAGKCVHCLVDPVARNWDHVFPKSWYPDTSATDLYKWQIPSCVPCNSAFGAIEEDFLRRVGLCLDPFDPASRSIVQKALRSMKPAQARNERDRNVRGALRQRILGEALEGAAIPQTGTFPGMGEKWGRRREDQ